MPSRRASLGYEASCSRGRGRASLAFWGCCVLVAGVRPLFAQACAPPDGIERINVSSAGQESDAAGLLPDVNGDGCLVAFASEAADLIANDTNERADVFVRDRALGTLRRIPRRPATGSEPREASFAPVLSADGDTVAFGSLSTNLVLGDFNTDIDVYVYDLVLDRGWLASLTRDGEAGGGVPALPPSLSADGRYTAFSAASDKLVAVDGNELSDVFVFDRALGTVELISVASVGTNAGRSADGASTGAAISADGCRVAFYSAAQNLVAADRNGMTDVFVRDRCAAPALATLVSVGADGAGANGASGSPGFSLSISADGRFVAFTSDASNLEPGDDNRVADVFVRDLAEGRTVRVSRGATAASGYPDISGDGRFVVFQSTADLTGGGVPGRSAVYVADLESGALRRLGDPVDGGQANGPSALPRISADGSTVVFQSEADNLVPDDANRVPDVFLVRNPLSVEEPTPTAEPEVTATDTATPTQTAAPTASVSPTATAEPTATAVPASPTPEGVEFCDPLCRDGETCRGLLGGRVVDGLCDPADGCRCVVGTRSPTATPVAVTPTPMYGGGSSGGGCSCRVGPVSQAEGGWIGWLAIGFPAVVRWLRGRRAVRAAPGDCEDRVAAGC